MTLVSLIDSAKQFTVANWRGMLVGGGLGLFTGGLLACQMQPAPKTITETKIVEKEVKVNVEVVRTVTVEKIVTVEKEVIKWKTQQVAHVVKVPVVVGTAASGDPIVAYRTEMFGLETHSNTSSKDSAVTTQNTVTTESTKTQTESKERSLSQTTASTDMATYALGLSIRDAWSLPNARACTLTQIACLKLLEVSGGLRLATTPIWLDVHGGYEGAGFGLRYEW